jgi:hypothetical protein
MAAAFAAGAPGSQDALRHQPVPSVHRGDPLPIAATPTPPAEWVIVFWRTAGADEFAAKRLVPGAEGALETRIETAGLAAAKIEYFFAYKTAAGIAYLPPNPPAAIFETALAGEAGAQAPEAAAAPSSFPFPLKLDASGDATLTQKMSQPVTPDPGQTSNLGLAWTSSKDDFALDVQTRASYTDRLQPGAPAADLPDMRISVTKNSHAIRAGDLQLAESEFTTGGGGNRGFEYVFDNKSLYFHLFTAGTQQLRGFKGLGIPRAAASLFGGAAGFTLAGAVTVKVVYLSGRDDPSLAANCAGTPAASATSATSGPPGTTEPTAASETPAASAPTGAFARRAGDLAAVVAESRLFNNALVLSTEYARSSYDADTSDAQGKVGSGAFRAGAALTLSFFDAKIGYHDIGRDFNTVAQPFFVNDRRRLEAGAGITIKTLRLSGSWASERNNTADDPEITTSKNILTQLDIAWQFLDNSSGRLGYGTSRQDAILNDNPVLQGNLLRTGFTAGLDVGITPLIHITLTGEKDEIRSADNPSVEGDSLGANLGASIQSPDHIMLAPTLGLTKTRNTSTGDSTLMLMAGLTGEVMFIPKLFSVNLISMVSRYDLGSGGVTSSVNVDSGLNLHLAKWIKIGEVVVSLRAALIQTKMSGQDIKDHRIFLKADISLGSGGPS